MKTNNAKANDQDMLYVMTDLLITQLAVAGVQQQAIRQILGCDINRVSRIAKHIKAAKKTAATRGEEG